MSYRSLAAVFLLGALTNPAVAQANKDVPIQCEAVDSIGTAHMAADGTIALWLKSLPPGPRAEGVLTYAPDDPQYEEIKKHLGGIKVDETKPVPPWCWLNSEP
jgi:hypothetical protein